MVTHSRILAGKIPWTEDPGGLQSLGSQSWTRLSRHHTRTGWLYKPCPSSRVTLPLGTAYTSEASLAEKKGVVLGVMLVQPLLHCLWTPKESSTAVDLTVNTCHGDGDRFYTEEEK